MITDALESMLTQHQRLFTFDSPLPPEQELQLLSFSGREAISELFSFQAHLISQDARIELKKLIGKKVTLGIALANGTTRYISAHVSDFVHTGADGGIANYTAELVPWIWILSRRRDSRIFQDKTTEQIVKEVFDYYLSLAEHEFRLSQPLKPISYCTQYQESDLNFVLRLLEQEGLFFTFEHSQEGHRMIISDDSSMLPQLERQPLIRYHSASVTETADSITAWSSARRMQPTRLTLKSFDYKQPGNPHLVQLNSVNQQGEVGQYEVFEYEGLYGYADADEGMRKARRRLEAMEVDGKTFHGESNCRAMEPGHYFELSQHYDHDNDAPDDRQFLLLSVTHWGQNNYANDGEAGYRNSFSCIRRKIPFRPALRTPRAGISGPQTAIVVGPHGEEIYTDELGRVKLQFHWDRNGEFNDQSSCWVRVTQSGASGGFGSIQIPRVGDEVVVVFLDGNPDRPLIMGSLYNSTNTPPWSLPANKTQSGFLTRSMKGDGGTANFFRFEDKAGAEQIIMHAERNMDTEIELDETHDVGNNRSITVGGTHTETVKKDTVVQVTEGSYTLQVDNQFIQVAAKQHIILQVGDSSITLTPEGIEIKGKVIVTTSTDTTQITGAAVRIND
ncbi:type VI secretion system tip protein TssI/VgrG [Pseudomonas sp. CJQ_7]|jgi:type VI secretion system secreted protein VgrG|uniref:Type VI secretion system tip protein VgrG n=1 Tax=Pseudomonas monteilii TaxID=76759 RepID=A0A2N1IWI5_9PSED|nr:MULTISPECIES: type VI secretion system tip protein TssI/VgrG [Pseudomonas]EKT4457724.1 type VI secretion system tip protein VgrG [Pseudomonas putida]EKT4471325.1 type VI secretion system tip protein VgrG [Pseudomonas putida]EKT4493538.1 type VI secretion system tip protein VgrG [Pseudomonas putida]EKT4512578.1 type VI secretion system tip protein VgrG [Pseudomonas putida]EKT4530840.1 type VI secretion system tip protein VgrG [Pseudomonas putida]